jgi:hypothetical protein
LHDHAILSVVMRHRDKQLGVVKQLTEIVRARAGLSAGDSKHA